MDHLKSVHVISRRKSFRTVGGVRTHFVLKIVRFFMIFFGL